MSTVLNVLPFLLHTLILFLYLRKSGPSRGVFLLLGGLAGALLILVPAYLSFWPKYYRHGALGWPHGIELALGPNMAFPCMALGVLFGWIFARTRPAAPPG